MSQLQPGPPSWVQGADGKLYVMRGPGVTMGQLPLQQPIGGLAALFYLDSVTAALKTS